MRLPGGERERSWGTAAEVEGILCPVRRTPVGLSPASAWRELEVPWAVLGMACRLPTCLLMMLCVTRAQSRTEGLGPQDTRCSGLYVSCLWEEAGGQTEGRPWCRGLECKQNEVARVAGHHTITTRLQADPWGPVFPRTPRPGLRSVGSKSCSRTLLPRREVRLR